MGVAQKPRPDFYVRLVGTGVRPWAVPMRQLAKILEAVQRLIEQRDEEQRDGRANKQDGQPDPSRILHLLEIKSGSAAYAVSAPDQQSAFQVLSDIGRSIENPSVVDWSEASLSSLKQLGEAAKSIGCDIEFVRSNERLKLAEVIVRITPETYSAISETAFIHAPTSVFARIERVGGATEQRCGIRLPESPQRMVVCKVLTRDLARQLGQYLYRDVVLTGRATWVRRSWRLRKLEIESFEPPKTGSILKALKAAHDAGGYAWDSVADPDAFIAEMRDS